MYANMTAAVFDTLRKVKENGEHVNTRGYNQKEILSYLVQIENPKDRVIVMRNRNNNIFALIAETLWVMAGKNDMEFLAHYLPRAVDFSDDGLVWRAAYGPRLRNWYGVDQFKELVQLINQDLTTKRGVMMIYDPQQDYVDSKDIPCNNWLHFIARNGRLHMNVTVRANDAIWGFGGINSFEWSFLHEMLATWTELDMGSLSWFTGSMHIYERHYTTAERIVANFNGQTLYDFGIGSAKFSTPFEIFDDTLHKCLCIEEKLRSGIITHDILIEIQDIEDELLKYSMLMLYVYNLFLKDGDKYAGEIVAIVEEFETNDFKIAAIEYISRKLKRYDMFSLTGKEQAFFDIYWNPKNKKTSNEEV